MGRLVDVGAVDDLAPGAIKLVTVEGRDLLLAHVAGGYYAAEDRCPHMGAPLSHGKLEGAIISCPRHGSQFDLRDGRVVRWTGWSGITLRLAKVLKAPQALKIYRVKPEGGRLLIEMEETP